MKKLFFLFGTSLLLHCSVCYSSDTLYFRLSNAVNTVKDSNGQYLRKCVKENDYYHTWDYNQLNILVVESFFTDTNFNRKLFCQKYFNERKGYYEGNRCYENGRLNGYAYSFNEKGDTTGYDLYDNSTFIKSWRKEEDKNIKVFKITFDAAKFPGGKEAWVDYLGSHIRYPKSLKKENIKGKVILEIIIDKEGQIESVTVLQSLHPLLDAEAIRVVKESPQWEPAIQNGNPVKYKMKQVFNF